MEGLARNILIIGGARSGKSRFAQEMALKLGGPVLFVATAVAGDEEMRRRIEEHRRARPASWVTLEVATQAGNHIARAAGDASVVVVDCITLLVSNVLGQYGGDVEHTDAALIEAEVDREIGELVACMERVSASFIMVANEVGLGLVPANPLGRLYRDLLGKVNQLLVQRADEVYLMVAGLPLRIKPAGSR